MVVKNSNLHLLYQRQSIKSDFFSLSRLPNNLLSSPPPHTKKRGRLGPHDKARYIIITINLFFPSDRILSCRERNHVLAVKAGGEGVRSLSKPSFFVHYSFQ